ncbi:MAG: PHP domain-containing protein [Desulfobacteraceae bacterium]|nr:PHP domain-containing protein [Desulfobacteraceae bacterium]
MIFDLHVHSTISSCGKLDIGDILKYSRSLGLDGVCITDHGTMEARQYVREGIQEDGLCVIFGMEYSTLNGDFLLFGSFEEIDPGFSDTQVLEIAEQTSGAAVAAHPLRSGRSVREHIFQKKLCNIVESINGRNTDNENQQAENLCRQFALTEIGGSDAHNLEELGKVVTRFNIPIQSRNDLIYALKNGLCEPQFKV